MSDTLFDFDPPSTTCPQCGRTLVEGICAWCSAPTTPAKHLHRRNDPVTSKEAAHSIDTTALEVMVLTAIEAAGRNGLTQDELLAMFDGFSYSSITARPAALKAKGLIVDSGMKRRGRSGRNQTVLVATAHLTSETNDRSSDSPVPVHADVSPACPNGHADCDPRECPICEVGR